MVWVRERTFKVTAGVEVTQGYSWAFSAGGNGQFGMLVVSGISRNGGCAVSWTLFDWLQLVDDVSEFCCLR